MPTTFLDLPWELRERIWNLAIRPAGRGVHFFSVYNCTTDDVSGEHDVVESSNWFYMFRLAAPRCKPRSATTTGVDERGGGGRELRASRTRHNPSTYLIDGGLWTACKESRRVMERAFRSMEWEAVRKDRRRDLGRVWHKDETMPVTGYFVGEDSKDRYFTVLPHRDLFCFQPQNLKTLDGREINYQIFVALKSRGFPEPEHIAIEYNPAWGADVEKADWLDRNDVEIVQTFVKAASHAFPMIDTIWLIDYRLKRRHHVPTKEQDDVLNGKNAKVFYGSDRRFYEIPGICRQDCPWENFDGDEAWRWGSSSLNFVTAIENAIVDEIDGE